MTNAWDIPNLAYTRMTTPQAAPPLPPVAPNAPKVVGPMGAEGYLNPQFLQSVLAAMSMLLKYNQSGAAAQYGNMAPIMSAAVNATAGRGAMDQLARTLGPAAAMQLMGQAQQSAQKSMGSGPSLAGRGFLEQAAMNSLLPQILQQQAQATQELGAYKAAHPNAGHYNGGSTVQDPWVNNSALAPQQILDILHAKQGMEADRMQDAYEKQAGHGTTEGF